MVFYAGLVGTHHQYIPDELPPSRINYYLTILPYIVAIYLVPMTSDDVWHSLLETLLHHLLGVLLQLGEDQASPGPPVHQFVLRAIQRREARVCTRVLRYNGAVKLSLLYLFTFTQQF